MKDLLDDYKKEQKKNGLKGFFRITVACILGIIFLMIDSLFIVGVIFLFLTVFFSMGFVFTSVINKEIYLKCTKTKKIEFPKYEITHKKFIEQCKKGIPDDTYIIVNDKVYSICVNKNSFYINFKKFKKLEEFLTYKLEGEYYLDNLKKVTFLQVNGHDPAIFFEENE